MAEAQHVAHRPHAHERKHKHHARVPGVHLLLREHDFFFFLVTSEVRRGERGIVQLDIRKCAVAAGGRHQGDAIVRDASNLIV